MATSDLISIIVPMLDEADHVEQLVADIAAQDVGRPLEVLVADGGSKDGSVEKLRAAANAAGLSLTVIDNPGRLVSHGLNLCIQRARGELIVRMDCHASYPPEYVRLLAEASGETGAWNVGGRLVPEGRTAMERAVACAMDSPFGGIGWTRHTAGDGRVEVDTVTYGAFRSEVLDRIGPFDESLLRNQDNDLNVRIRKAGGTVVMDPAIVVHYVPRGSLRGVFRQYREYGRWKMTVMRKHGQVTGGRSLVSLGLVSSLATLALAGTVSKHARRLLALELGAYATGALVFGAVAVRRRNESLSLLPRLLAVYPAFHVAHGIGMIEGLLTAPAEQPSEDGDRSR